MKKLSSKECKLESGEIMQYGSLHRRLGKENGKAEKCMKCDGKKAKRFEWALIKGRSYSLDINDYIQLCASCHRHYDKCYGNIGEIVKRKLIDIKTKKEYRSIKEASIDLGINYSTLCNYFKPNRNNKTNLRYA